MHTRQIAHPDKYPSRTRLQMLRDSVFWEEIPNRLDILGGDVIPVRTTSVNLRYRTFPGHAVTTGSPGVQNQVFFNPGYDPLIALTELSDFLLSISPSSVRDKIMRYTDSIQFTVYRSRLKV